MDRDENELVKNRKGSEVGRIERSEKRSQKERSEMDRMRRDVKTMREQW